MESAPAQACDSACAVFGITLFNRKEHRRVNRQLV